MTMCFIKSITIFLVFISLANQLKFKRSMKKFGCLLYPYSRSSQAYAAWSMTSLPLSVVTLRNFVFTKGIDLILSPLMWATLLEQAGKL
jgi:hypothetical protein